MSDLVGEDIKTGPGDRSEIMYMFVVNSLLTCKGDADVTSDVTLSIYMAAQDGDMDGLPDEGEESICIGPMDFESAQRRSKGGTARLCE